MPVVGRLIGRGTDTRWVIVAGVLMMVAGTYWMSQLNLEISPGQVVWPRVVLVLGLSICFAPANLAAYLYTPPLLRGAAVGLLVCCATKAAASGRRWRRRCRSAGPFHTCGSASPSIL